jgi:hypothetical protein
MKVTEVVNISSQIFKGVGQESVVSSLMKKIYRMEVS